MDWTPSIRVIFYIHPTHPHTHTHKSKMLRNTPLGATPTYKLLLGFGLCSLGGAMLYAYFKNRPDEDDQEDSNTSQQAKTRNGGQEPTAQKEVCLKIVVSNEHVPLIMGRGGSNIKLIEEKTSAKIRLR